MKRVIPALLMLALASAGCAPPAPYGRPGYGEAGRGGRNVTSMPVARKAVDIPVLGKKKGRYRVKQPWTVRLAGETFIVQKGYTSNGITASGKLKASLGDGVDKPETWSAVFHDWLFTQPGMTRAKADRLFYEILLAYGVPEMKARLMYSSVSVYSASKLLR